jgi:hypothetical protein
MPSRKKKDQMRVVTMYGTMWARNEKNIANIPNGAVGVYILFDGSMPMYVGKGDIAKRIDRAGRSIRRGEMWDRFSWYAIKNPRMMHDLEALMLRLLPRNLRFLTLQGGNFVHARRRNQADEWAVPIKRKEGPHK